MSLKPKREEKKGKESKRVNQILQRIKRKGGKGAKESQPSKAKIKRKISYRTRQVAHLSNLQKAQLRQALKQPPRIESCNPPAPAANSIPALTNWDQAGLEQSAGDAGIRSQVRRPDGDGRVSASAGSREGW